jgi:hypothetical protein
MKLIAEKSPSSKKSLIKTNMLALNAAIEAARAANMDAALPSSLVKFATWRNAAALRLKRSAGWQRRTCNR